MTKDDLQDVSGYAVSNQDFFETGRRANLALDAWQRDYSDRTNAP